MLNNNVSFCGAAAYRPLKKIANATVGEITEAIKMAHKNASKAVGYEIAPNIKLSGENFRRLSPDSFTSTRKLSEQGKKGFDKLHKRYDLTTSSRLCDLEEVLKYNILRSAFETAKGKGATCYTPYIV